MRLISCVIIVSLSLAFHPSGMEAQVLAGTVRDMNRDGRIPHVELTVTDSLGSEVLAEGVGPDGSFRLALPGPGRYRLLASALGYRSARTPLIEVDAGETKSLEVALPATPFALDPVNVEAPRPLTNRTSPVRVGELDRGTLSDLLPQANLVSLLRALNMPSLRVTEMYIPGSSTYLPCVQFVRGLSPRNRGCRMVKIVLNGHAVPDPAGFLWSFDPSLLERVEFLPPTTAGARWGTGAENGVLILEERGR